MTIERGKVCACVCVPVWRKGKEGDEETKLTIPLIIARLIAICILSLNASRTGNSDRLCSDESIEGGDAPSKKSTAADLCMGVECGANMWCFFWQVLDAAPKKGSGSLLCPTDCRPRTNEKNKKNKTKSVCSVFGIVVFPCCLFHMVTIVKGEGSAPEYCKRRPEAGKHFNMCGCVEEEGIGSAVG
ncbi:hypothetical protein TcCL_ESM03198 [Trypanosoma cruzi]|nr:hypothetical protein TcCL_ESM03198 [Trypanosoma cruzi]